MRNFSPQTEQFNERLITREQKDFSAGAFDDIPASRIPNNGVKYLENYIINSDGSIGVRNGTRKWSSVALPAIPGKTGLAITKSGTTVTIAGYTRESTDVGRYVVYDDGSHELITALYGDTVTNLTVENSTTRAASTAGKIRGAVHGWYYHSGKDKIVVHMDKYIFVTDGSIDSWVQAFPLGAYNFDANGPTKFSEVNNKVIAFNNDGVFCVDLDFTGKDATNTSGAGTNQYVYYKLNAPLPATAMEEDAATGTDEYRYRYLYGYARLRKTDGTAIGFLSDRTSSGVAIDHESGPVAANTTTLKDYSNVYTTKPIGPGTEFYSVLTSGGLAASFDTIAEIAAITNGQFKITMDATTKNIQCDFTGCTSWAEIASVIDLGVKDYFINGKCEYVGGKIVFTNTGYQATSALALAAIGYVTAGDGGTDIGATYLGCQDGTGVITAPAKNAVFTHGDLARALNIDLDSNSLTDNHWTHFTVWRTKDIGTNGINGQTGEGNNKEAYVWVADIPIIKVFTGALVAGTLTATTDVFTASDIGATVFLASTVNGGSNLAEITGYTSATIVTCSGAAFTSQPCIIGSYTLSGSAFTGAAISASQTGTAITKAAAPAGGPVFAAADVGRALYWADGGVSLITAYVSATAVTAAWSATHASQAAGKFSGALNFRGFTDSISDDTLGARAATLSLPNRFWEPIPAPCEAGIISNGFMLAAQRGGKTIYYSQLPQGMEYLYGYCNKAKQVITTKDLITAIDVLQNIAVVFCYNTLISVPLNIYSNSTLEEVGEVVAVLTGQNVLSPDTGCVDYGSIVSIDGFRLGFFTSDSELCLLEYSGGGVTMTEDLSKDRFSKRLAESIAMAVSYDKYNGIILSLRTTANPLSGSPYTASGIPTDTSYRVAILKEQGVGFSANTGGAWSYMPCQVGNVLVYDSNNLIHSLIIDNADGYVYDISQREGPTGGSLTKLWNDKAGTDGTGGTAIQPSVLFREDEGTFEHYFLNHKEAHIYLRPYDENSRNDSGYNSAGYKTGTTFALDWYIDGEPDTESAENEDILVTGDIVVDKLVRAHRIQMKLSATHGAHIVTGVQSYYESESIADAPAANVSTEMENQEAFATPVVRLLGYGGALKNLATGETIAATKYSSLETGPDGNSSAVAVAASAGVDVSVTLTGDFSVVFSFNASTVSSTVFSKGTASLSLTIAGVTATVVFTDGTTSVSQALGWTGTGWGYVCVTRSGTALAIMEGYSV